MLLIGKQFANLKKCRCKQSAILSKRHFAYNEKFNFSKEMEGNNYLLFVNPDVIVNISSEKFNLIFTEIQN